MNRLMFALVVGLVAAVSAVQPAEQPNQTFTRIRSLERAEAKRPDDANVESELALNFFLADQRQLFQEALAKTIKLDPDLAQAYYLAGRFELETQQDPRSAISSFRKALELAADSSQARYYLGIALRAIGQNEMAKAELQRATQLATNSRPFCALAEVELDLNAPEAALQVALTALKVDPQSTDNFVIAGKIYERLGQRDDAVRMFQQAEKLDPLADAPHYRLMKLYGERTETQAESRNEAGLFRKLKSKDTPGPRKRVPGADWPNGSPQAKSREELDGFGDLVQATNSLDVIRGSERFLIQYPASEFREKILELEFESFRQRNDYGAVRRLTGSILALNRWNASVLADSAILIANHNDSVAFALAEEYAARAIEAADATERPAHLPRAVFFQWKDNVLATAGVAEGILAMRRQDAQTAVTRLEEAIKLRPAPDGVDFLRLGEAWVMKGDSKRAEEAFSRAETLGPSLVADQARAQREGIGTKLSVADAKIPTPEEEAARYEKIIKSTPNVAEAHHNLGLIYYQLHEYARAKASLQRALQLKPTLAGTELFLGLSEFRLGEFQNSAHHLEAALRPEPDNREALLTLIRDQTALGQFGEGTVKAAMARFPHDTELNYTIGLACLERIREIASAATEIGSESPSSLWLRLRRAESAGDTAAANKLKARVGSTREPPSVEEYDRVSSLLRQSFETVLANGQDSNAAHSIQGYLFEARGMTDDALSEYRKAGDHFAAGQLLAQNVRLQEAESELEAAVQADPQNDRAKADLGKLYVQRDEADKAAILLQSLVKRYPDDPYAWADLGKAQGALGNNSVAIKCLQTALNLDPGLNQLHYQLALLYRKQGREDLTTAELAEFKRNKGKDH